MQFRNNQYKWDFQCKIEQIQFSKFGKITVNFIGFQYENIRII